MQKSVPEVPTDAFCREHREEDPVQTKNLEQLQQENEKPKKSKMTV